MNKDNPFEDYKDDVWECYASLAVVCCVMLAVGFVVGLWF